MKQSLSHRVVDDQMPQSRFTAAERNDLMTLGENIVSAPGEVIRFVDEVLLRGSHPDIVLSEVVRRQSENIISIEDHESILQDVKEEHLTEEEQRQADEDYQQELAAEQNRNNPTNFPVSFGLPAVTPTETIATNSLPPPPSRTNEAVLDSQRNETADTAKNLPV